MVECLKFLRSCSDLHSVNVGLGNADVYNHSKVDYIRCREIVEGKGSGWGRQFSRVFSGDGGGRCRIAPPPPVEEEIGEEMGGDMATVGVKEDKDNDYQSGDRDGECLPQNLLGAVCPGCDSVREVFVVVEGPGGVEEMVCKDCARKRNKIDK